VEELGLHLDDIELGFFGNDGVDMWC